MSDLAIPNYFVSFLTIVVGIVAFFTPSWFQAFNIPGFLSIKSGLVLFTLTGENGEYLVKSSYPLESSNIRTAIVLFPLGLVFASIGLIRAFQAQRYHKSNRLGQPFLYKVQSQALGFYLAAGMFLLISLAIFTGVTAPNVAAINRIGNLRAGSGSSSLGSTNNRPSISTSRGNSLVPIILPSPPRFNGNRRGSSSSFGNRRSSSSFGNRGSSSSFGSRGSSFSGGRGGGRGRGKRNVVNSRQSRRVSASFGYSFYLGWTTLLLEGFAIVFNALLTKKFRSPNTTNAINMT